MKKKLSLALAILMMLLTFSMPMVAWADKDDADNGGGTQVEEPKSPDSGDSGSKADGGSKTEEKPSAPEKEDSSKKDNSGSKDKSSKKDSSSKKSSGKSDSEKNNSQKTKQNNNYNTQYQPQEPEEEEVESNIKKNEISIIFTHDMHSHIDSDNVPVQGSTIEQGGFARMATIFKDISPDYRNDSFVLDAGDFSQGTAYQTIYTEEAAELRLMGYLGFDATTLGNHEFDYGSKGLAKMLKNAVKLTEDEEDYKLPRLLISNIDWKATMAEARYEEDAEKLQKAFDKYNVEEEYKLIKKNGKRIAVFGIFGKDSDICAPNSGTYFKDQIETAKDIVSKIKKEDKRVDLIVCISHSGTSDIPEESEDEILAEAVPDIDLIISAHTHTKLEPPKQVGDTVIASVGCYTANVGHILYKKDKKTDEYKMKSYKLIHENESVEEDKDTLKEIKKFTKKVNEEYFNRYGYNLEDKLTTNKISFTDINDFGLKQGEDTLGNLIADSYIYAIKEAEGSKYETVDVAVVPQGIVRGSIPEGDVTVADAFNILSLGSGPDGTSCYPLVSMYLTGKEIKNLAEIDASVSDDMMTARLYMSGLSYTINTKRLKYNRAVDVMVGEGKDAVPVGNDKLYRVVCDLYSCQMLAAVTEKSKGLLVLLPKDKDGNPVINYNDYILKDKGEEIKTWYALATYLDSMKKVKKQYKEAEGRKTIIASKNPVELLKQPNKVGWIARLVVLIPLGIILLIILIIIFRRRRRDANRMFRISDKEKKAIFAAPKKQKNLFTNNGKRDKRDRRISNKRNRRSKRNKRNWY